MLLINPKINKKTDIPGLTILRGTAALLVAIHHFGLISLQLRGAEIGPLLSKFGLLGMSLFFVLSGFVINYSYRNQITSNGSSGVKNFLVARIARLAPLYLLFIVVNFFINCLFLDPSGYLLYLKSLPVNLLAMQSWLYVKLHGAEIVNTQNLANISWSISTEWLLYLLYIPFAFFILRGKGSLKKAFLILFSGIFFRVLLIETVAESIVIDGNKFGEWLIYYSPYGRWFEFMSGIGLSEIWLRRYEITRKLSVFIWCLVAFSVLYIFFSLFDALLINVPTLFAGYRAYGGYAVAAPFIIYLACNLRVSGKTAIFLTPLLFLGEISYSVYLLHGDLISLFTVSGPLSIGGYSIKAFFFFSWLFLLSMLSFMFIEMPGKNLVIRYAKYLSQPKPPTPWAERLTFCKVYARRNSLILSALVLLLFTAFYLAPSPNYKTRINDLSRIKVAIEMYRKERGNYPVADYSSLISSKFVINDDWIPGLAPKYISSLPRDVRKNNMPGQQYLYVSDGKEYKLVAHGVDDSEMVKKKMPGLIDPRRPDMSYGFWTAGARDW